MQQEINPLHFSNTLVNTYRRYLFSATPISQDESQLREEFLNQLNQFHFHRGPFIHCQPTYKRSIRFLDLFSRKDDLSLDPRLKRCFSSKDLENSDFRLYTHQSDSLVKAKDGENLLIATGTGSGKTECFTLPILDDAIKNPGPGIRSIIIYPMNALANDQLERLAGMLRHYSKDEVTFGRYTGETPWNDDDARDKYPNYEPCPCERFTREQIRQSPPHILLTNFAMLEYLLIRPRDAQIFRHQRLRFVVLDEAHTYRGSQGIEVALLMRRLREAFNICTFQSFLTSATFTSGSSSDVKQDLSEFATNLTGANFRPENVLFGDIKESFPKEVHDETLPEDKLLASLGEEDSLNSWISALSDPNAFNALALKSGLIAKKQAEEGSQPQQLLYKLLRQSALLKKVYEATSETTMSIPEFAQAIWGQDKHVYRRAVQWLLIMGTRARSSPEAAPLLETRIHMFFRGLSGASICLNPDCPGKEDHPETRWSSFSLQSMRNCPKCQSKVFPLEVCWHCGLPVLPVYISSGHWTQLAPPLTLEPIKRNLTWWDGTEIDDLESDTAEKNEQVEPRHAYVCTCGFYGETEQTKCACGKTLLRLRILESFEGHLERCPRCGGEAGAFEGVTRSFTTADDAPTAVLAETIMRSLPDEPNSSEKPAGGRRLLAFSDSRQRAAFFAPYLKRTTCQSAYQKPLMEAIRKETEVLGQASFKEVASRFVALARRQPYLVTWENTGKENETYNITPSRMAGHSALNELRKNCLISLYRHFCCSLRQRNKLAGLGLSSVFVEFLPVEQNLLCKELPQLCNEGNRYLPALQILLSVFLSRQAVRFIEQVQAHEIGGMVLDSSFHRMQSSSSQKNRISRWNPYLAPARVKRMAVDRSRQLKFLCKMTGLNPENDQEKLSDLLNVIWESLHDHQYPDDSMLVDCQLGRRKLNGDRLLLEVPKQWFRCKTCGHLVPPSINYADLCPSPDCRGTLESLDARQLDEVFRNHHERARFTLPPLALEVKEHTAQLQLRSSKKYQEDFKNGLVNVLSCSTTFEMGVDVGDLKVVTLRNIPPSPANYIQRAGRVGRRQEGVSYVVSFARKTPHDQYFFGTPQRMISGQVDIPFLCLKNDVLAQRHTNSFLLGAFLSDEEGPRLGEPIRILGFFLNSNLEVDVDGSPASHFPAWMKKNRGMILDALSRMIPKESRLTPEKAYQNARFSLYGTDGNNVLQRDVQRTILDYNHQITELEEEAQRADSAKYKSIVYRCIEDISNYKRKFAGRRLIDFLSGVGWLPGYAFPQDNIELRVLQANYSDKMSLTRDRLVGIAEYAPGAEIVADGRVFKSKGVVGRKLSPQASLFEAKKYVACRECRILKQLPGHSREIPRTCDCGRRFPRPRAYIIPEGFSTSIKDRAEYPRFRRVAPPPNSEVFLVEGAREDEFRSHPAVPWISYALKEEAKLFRANMGFRRNQFRLCMKCGAAIESGSGHGHLTLWGNRCSGGTSQIKPVDLAHEFKTDVLEMRFFPSSLPTPSISKRDFWISLLTAFLNGVSRRLNIDHGDLAGIYHRVPETSSEGELVIYDRIPGGAGYLQRIINNIRECVDATLDVVEKCNDPACNDLDSSCYSCLRSYNNQFDWDDLKRKPVIDWLSPLLK